MFGVKVRSPLSVLCAAVVCLWSDHNTFAEQLTIDFSSTSRAETSDTLLADLLGPAAELAYGLSGSEFEQDEERETCAFFLDGVDDADELIGSFNAARSNLSATLVIAEDRAIEKLGRAWLTALEAFGETYDIDFAGLSEREFFFPIMLAMNIQVDGSISDDVDISPELRNFLLARLRVEFLRESAPDQESFSETGILRATTRELPVVCALLIFDHIEFIVEVKARILDRVVTTRFLDRECLSSMIKYSSAAYYENLETFREYSAHPSLAATYFIADIVRSTPPDAFFSGPLNDGKIPCSFHHEEKEAKRIAFTQWSELLAEWVNVLRSNSGVSLADEQIANLTRYSYRSDRRRTDVVYRYSNRLQLQ